MADLTHAILVVLLIIGALVAGLVWLGRPRDGDDR
jgi:hypothetical protein